MKINDISDVMPVVTAIARKTMNEAGKNLPKIFVGCGVGCLFGAVITTATGMHKADQKIAEEEQRREEALPEYDNKTLTIKEKVELTWTEFVPAAFFTAAATAFIIASEREGSERYLAMASALALSQQANNERKEAEAGVLPQEDVERIDERVRALRAASIDIPDYALIPRVTNDGNETLYIESVTKTPFYAKENDVLHAFNVMNHRLNVEDVASVSDILEDLGLRTSRASDAFVWSNTRYGSVIDPFFKSTFLDDDPAMPATWIEYSIDPDIEQ